ncbi:MAG TPA: MerR family transcriptional regulator, partial [Acidimicrobiales bacterium]|nr:MerR family transcriptional regulator [Acidimicrobiales bacterium]
MPERAYKSIGEVLSELKEEFPDITISKIRFLESQGLLDPERTPSGYRKFYDDDVERLRWILRQQREHFLPLKVIKGRLSAERRPDAERPTPPEAPRPQPVSTGGAAPEAEAGRGLTAPPDTASPAPAGRPPAASVTSPPGAAGEQAAGARPLLSAGPTGVSLTFEELSSASGLSVDWLRELERSGFLTGR